MFLKQGYMPEISSKLKGKMDAKEPTDDSGSKVIKALATQKVKQKSNCKSHNQKEDKNPEN